MAENAGETASIAPVSRRPWIRSLALGVVVLLCGAVIGGVVTAVILQQRPTHGMRSRPDRLPERIAEDMQRKYGLTDAQKQQIVGVFREHGKKLSDIRAEVQPRVDAEHEALRHSVEAVLTPEQAAQWRTEFEQMRRPWHFRGGGAPAPAEGR